MDNNNKVINTVFEGMRFHIDNDPYQLHGLFNGFKSIDVEVSNGMYIVQYNKTKIADIMDFSKTIAPENMLTFTPGIFIHRKIAVFKTYNKLLKTFSKGLFLKFIANKWTLCEDKNETEL